jgi:hypothetical protein
MYNSVVRGVRVRFMCKSQSAITSISVRTQFPFEERLRIRIKRNVYVGTAMPNAPHQIFDAIRFAETARGRLCTRSPESLAGVHSRVLRSAGDVSVCDDVDRMSGDAMTDRILTDRPRSSRRHPWHGTLASRAPIHPNKHTGPEGHKVEDTRPTYSERTRPVLSSSRHVCSYIWYLYCN